MDSFLFPVLVSSSTRRQQQLPTPPPPDSLNLSSLCLPRGPRTASASPGLRLKYEPEGHPPRSEHRPQRRLFSELPGARGPTPSFWNSPARGSVTTFYSGSYVGYSRVHFGSVSLLTGVKLSVLNPSVCSIRHDLYFLTSP